jgi:hypothetical protein
VLAPSYQKTRHAPHVRRRVAVAVAGPNVLAPSYQNTHNALHVRLSCGAVHGAAYDACVAMGVANHALAKERADHHTICRAR